MKNAIFNTEFPKQELVSIVGGVGLTLLWVLALLVFGFSLPLFILYISLATLIIFLTPSAGLPVILLSLMWFERWFTLQPIIFGDQVYKIYPVDFLLFASFFAVFFHNAFGRHKRRMQLNTSLHWLLVFMALSFFYFVYSLTNTHTDPSLAFSAFKNYAFYALFAFFIILNVQTKEELSRLVQVVLVGGLGILVFLLIGIARGEGLWTQYTPLSTSGVRLLAFPHALYLCLVMSLAGVLLAYQKIKNGPWLTVLWIQLFGVLSSLMRHLWMSLVVGFIFVFFLINKQQKKWAAVWLSKSLVVAIMIFALWSLAVLVFPFSSFAQNSREWVAPFTNRASSFLQTAKDSSARWRLYAWRAAKDSFVEHPVFGVGYGQDLTIEFDTYQRVIAIRELHNSYLVMLVQMGAVGLAVFLWFLYQAFRTFWHDWSKSKNPILLGSAAALILFLFAAFWQPYFETNLIGIWFWVLLGLMIQSGRLYAHPQRQ